MTSHDPARDAAAAARSDLDQPELPGLEVHPGDVRLVAAAKRDLARLHREGKLPELDGLLPQLVLDLSAAVAAGARSGRASAVAQAAQQLRETWLVLEPPPEDLTDATEAQRRALSDLVDALHDAAASQARVSA